MTCPSALLACQFRPRGCQTAHWRSSDRRL